jgi:curved DNA-binding protein CbpA
LGLNLGVSEREAKVKFRASCRIYHPDKHDLSKTGLTDLQAKEKFQAFNNAYEYVRDKL